MESPTPFESDPLTGRIIGSAIEVHRIIGPGLIESIYENALCHELSLRGMTYEQQIETNVFYKGKIIKGQRIDLIIDREIVIEVKSVSRLHEVVFAQLLSYLKITGLKRGLILNFGEKRLVDGIRRVSN
jgi:GxxExxY protein